MTEHGQPEVTGELEPPSHPQSGDSKPGNTLFSKLGWMGSVIRSPALSRGDRAELRRMRVGEVPPEVYWRLTDMLDPVPSAREDAFWMTVMALMVRYPHRSGASPGRVLADAGVKSARVMRWLRRDQQGAWREAVRLLSPLKGAALDWGSFGSLLARWQDETVRRRFARNFFSAAHGRKAPTLEGDEE